MNYIVIAKSVFLQVSLLCLAFLNAFTAIISPFNLHQRNLKKGVFLDFYLSLDAGNELSIEYEKTRAFLKWSNINCCHLQT